MKITTIAIIRQTLKDEIRESQEFYHELKDKLEEEEEGTKRYQLTREKMNEVYGWYITYKEALEDFKKEFPYEE